MKKIFYLPIVLSVVACVPTDNLPQQEEPSVNIEEVVNTIDEKLVTNHDLFEIAQMYKISFMGGDCDSECCGTYSQAYYKVSDFPVSIHEDLQKVSIKSQETKACGSVKAGDLLIEGKINCGKNHKNYAYYYKANDSHYYPTNGSDEEQNQTTTSFGLMLAEKMLKPELLNDSLLFKCFDGIGYYGNYLDQSDECIVYRRTHSIPTMCGFNYSKYLPTITTDEQFKAVLSMVEAAKYNIKKCDVISDITTAERAACKQQYVNFVNDFFNKKTLSCKKSHPKEWQEILTEIKEDVKQNHELYEYLSKELDKKIKTSQTSLLQDIASTIYENSYKNHVNAIHDALEKFKWKYLCIPDHSDLNNIIKKGLKEYKTNSKIGKVITLN